MKDKRKINLIVVIAGCLFMAICIALLVSLLLDGSLGLIYKIEILADIFACIIGTIYLVEGYTKNSANRYKACMIMAAINALIVTVTSAVESIQYIPVIMCGIAFALITLLAFGNNLGKKISYICCGLVLLIRIAGLISLIATNNNTVLNNVQVILVVCQLSLSIMLLIMTYAKYTDKQARGSK